MARRQTHQEKLLRHLLKYKKAGITIREAQDLYKINWPHKRIGELEEMGIGIRRIDEHDEEGQRFRRYALLDPKQPRIKEVLEILSTRK